ncbi:hypothetical protein AX14_009685 [Amanita brunnescens Koide BX004]|nr:hypothetical protein AX14_009685 [Amanita brunnescens Koide BX004]
MGRAKKQKLEPISAKRIKGSPRTEPKESLPKSFKIIVGTYEKLLYGLDARVSISSGKPKLQFSLSPIFAFPAHVSCIKAVAASPDGGKWLATGSADEIIKVWDLRRRKEVGGLMHHQGSITHLLFPSRSHLLSASEDGTLCLFHARDWTVLRAMKGHKARINAVAVHPSGKVALSVGQDRTLRMWDLMRGKGVASTKIGKEGEIVRWSTDGSKFVVQSGSTMDIYDTSMTLLHTITHPSRLHDVKFSPRASGEGGELLLAGAEDKKLAIYEVSSPPRLIAELVGHERRVKALQTITIQLPPPSPSPSPSTATATTATTATVTGTAISPQSTSTSTIIVCTASSDGKIRVFDLALVPSEADPGEKGVVQIGPEAEYDTKGTRLTCIALADGDDEGEATVGKRKRAEEEDDDEEWGGLGEHEDENENEDE